MGRTLPPAMLPPPFRSLPLRFGPIAAATALFLLGPSTPASTSTQRFLQDFEKSVARFQLPNGLRLLVVRRRTAPVVSCYIKFHAGSVDETDKTAGIAHMLEHMLFKGTRTVGTTDFEKENKYQETIRSFARKLDAERRQAEEAAARGDRARAEEAARRAETIRNRMQVLSQMARRFAVPDEDSYLYGLHGQRNFNAYTNRDLTNYQVTLPANRLPVWARIESDRIRNSVLRDFYTERDVVAEERRMRVENNPRGLLFEQFTSAVYGKHPYGRPVIGPMRSIQYLNYEQAFDFYSTYYAPNNTVIALVGDVDPGQAAELVRRHFGELKPKEIPKPKLDQPTVPPGGVRVVLRRPGSPLLFMAWFKPAFPHEDDLRLSVLATILTGGEDGRLYRRLVIEQKVAASISVYSQYPGERYRNLFFVYGVPAPGRTLDELERAIGREIDEIRKNGPTPAEMSRARTRLLTDFVYGLRSNDQLADQLSYYELLNGDFRTVFRAYRQLDEMDAAGVRESASRLLAPVPMTARLEAPESPAKKEARP